MINNGGLNLKKDFNIPPVSGILRILKKIKMIKLIEF